MKNTMIKSAGICLAAVLCITSVKTSIGLDSDVGDDMVYVSEGYFIMGSDTGFSNEKPERKVFVRGFYIDKYEVTNEQYKQFIIATKNPAPKEWVDDNYPAGQGNFPVTNISYYDAAAFARWKGKRLPKEDEWEKAARGIDGRKYPWGNAWLPNANIYSFSGKSELKPVGSFKNGTSPYGCFDMSGSVWEWTDTWYKLVSESENKLNIKYKIVKGGSWLKASSLARCSVREALPTNDGYGDVGIRCVK
jgi:formylglycine-generating enzyme required for sulfatase activity